MRAAGLILLLLAAARAEAAISYVRSNRANGTSVTSVNVSLSATSGDCLVVGISQSTNVAVSSITDNAGATYTLLGTATSFQNHRQELWSTSATGSGASTTTTVNFASSVQNAICAVAEYSGVSAVGGFVTRPGPDWENAFTFTLPATTDANNFFVAGLVNREKCNTCTVSGGNTRQNGINDRIRGFLWDNTDASAGTSISVTASCPGYTVDAAVGVELRSGTSNNTYTQSPTATNTNTFTPTPTPGCLSFVRSASNQSTTGTSVSVTMTIDAGKAIVVTVHTGTGATVTSVTDTGGTTYTLAARYAQTTNVELWYALSASASTSLTVNLSSSDCVRASAAQYNGVAAFGGIQVAKGCANIMPISILAVDDNNWIVTSMGYNAAGGPISVFQTYGVRRQDSNAPSGGFCGSNHPAALIDQIGSTAGTNIQAIGKEASVDANQWQIVGIELRCSSTNSTYTLTNSPTATVSGTHTRTATDTRTATHTASATVSGTHTRTATATVTATSSETATATSTATATATNTVTATATSSATATSTSTPTLTPTAPLAYQDDPVYGAVWAYGSAQRALELDRSGPFSDGRTAHVWFGQTPVAVWTADPYRRIRVVSNYEHVRYIETAADDFVPGTGQCIEPETKSIVTRPYGATRAVWLACPTGTCEATLWTQPD